MISIPYGSIKSEFGNNGVGYAVKFQFLMVRLKAELLQSSRNTVHIFQFLMVRLKARSLQDSPSHTHISIPYGSIKSIDGGGGVSCFHISIPYGSIKRVVAVQKNEKQVYFNSLWFD